MRGNEVLANERQKRLFFWATVSLMLIFLASMLATAEEALIQETEALAATLHPIEYGDVVSLFPVLIEAFKSGHWMVFGGGLVMSLTWAVKHYVLPKLALKDAVLPLVALLLGLLGAASAELVAGKGFESAVYILIGGLVSPAVYDTIKGLKKS
jgi:hypothetical protein